MPIGIRFRKRQCQEMLDLLAEKNVHECLQFAGACLFQAMSHGPAIQLREDWSELPLEHREQRENALFQELLGAIRLHADFTAAVVDEEYDDVFDGEIEGVVDVDGGVGQFHATRGVKDGEEDSNV